MIEEETAKELLELRSGVIDEVVTDEVYVTVCYGGGDGYWFYRCHGFCRCD